MIAAFSASLPFQKRAPKREEARGDPI